MSYINTIRFSESAIDTFNRLRVSTPKTIFDTKQLFDNMPLQWTDITVSGTAASTYSINRSSTTISVSASTAGRRTRQTKRRFNYQPGKSPLIFMTAVVGAFGAGITKRLGLYDDKNGVFFQFSANVASVVVRSFVTGVAVDTAIPQSSWDTDKFDGTGKSGITLDFTKAQIFVIDYEWLGVGIVRYGFVVNGVLYYCHKVYNANVLSSVYMSTPNLPLRYEIINDGTGPATGLECICSTYIIEGGEDETGLPGSIPRGSSPLPNNVSVTIPLFAFRLKAGYIGASVKPVSLTIDPDNACLYTWYLILNPTVTGNAFAFTGLNNYSIEFDITKTASTIYSAGSGAILASGTQRDTTSGGGIDFNFAKDFYLGADYNNNSDVLAVFIQKHTGAAINFYASLNFIDQK